jgi:hypothetical protein
MAGVFETATRAAIEEIIQAHAQASKFGFVLTKESFGRLTDDIYDLLVTSRNLKAAGDRFLGASPAAKATPASRATLPVRGRGK